ncbi:hypothetical protein BH09ACT8_BH09ACT8_07080 [soil metagenome]
MYSRGADVEGKAFYYVAELEQIIREWIGSVYHHTKHDGLCIPSLPRERFSPVEMFEIGLARSGSLTLPARAELVYEFLYVASSSGGRSRRSRVCSSCLPRRR